MSYAFSRERTEQVEQEILFRSRSFASCTFYDFSVRVVLGWFVGQVEGTEVVLARTLDEGRALIRGSESFDVVALDLTLPDGEGTELIAEIRQRRP